MSDPGPLRRMVADLRVGGRQAPFTQIGNRTIHQYWTQLAPYFRTTLLVPQRRPDGSGVSWTWREPADSKAPTAAELAELRQRLNAATKSLANALADGEPSSHAPLLKGIGEMIGRLAGKNDSALGAFACRTESGVMVHSWGAATAAVPYQADARDYEVSGKLYVGEGESAAGLTVVIENRQGAVLARTQTDPTGEFRFKEISSGSYRVRVTDKVDFPPGGQLVTVEGNSIAGLEFRRGSLTAAGEAAEGSGVRAVEPGAGDSEFPGPALRQKTKARRRLFWLVVVGLVIGGIIWVVARPAATSSMAGTRSAAAPTRASLAIASTDAVGKRGNFSLRTESSATTALLAPGELAPTHATIAGDHDHRRNPAIASALSKSSGSESAVSLDEQRAQLPPGHSADSPNAADDRANDGSNLLEPSAAVDEPQERSELPPDSPGMADARGEPPADENARRATRNRSALSAKKGGVMPSPQSLRADTEKGPSLNGPEASEEDSPSVANSEPDKSNANSPTRSPNAGKKIAKKKTLTRKSSDSGQMSAADAAEVADETADDLAELTDEQTSGKHPAQKRPSKVKRGTVPSSAQSASRPEGLDADPEAGLVDDPAPEDESDANGPIDVAPQPRDKPPNKEPDAETEKKEPKDTSLAPDPEGESAADEPAEQTPDPPHEPAAKRPLSSTPPHLEPEASSPNPLAIPGTSSSDPSGENVPNLRSTVVADRGGIGPPRRVLVSPVKLRMVKETILPTQPMLLENEGAIEALRNKLRAEQLAKIPAILKQAPLLMGFTFVVAESRGPGGTPAAHWESADASALGQTEVHGNRAEVWWNSNHPPALSEFVLRCADGREIARVRLDREGLVLVASTSDARASLWFGVERPAFPSGISAVEPASRSLVWRARSGTTLPVAWTADEAWTDDRRSLRVDLPLAAAAAQTNHALALVEPDSGWALAFEVKFP